MLAQSMSDFSPVLKAATLCGGILVLFITIKVGQFIIKVLFGLIALGLLGAAAWLFLGRP